MGGGCCGVCECWLEGVRVLARGHASAEGVGIDLAPGGEQTFHATQRDGRTLG
jgi:hypothetical protein